MQKFINYLKSITPLTEQQEADVKAELERLMEVPQPKIKMQWTNLQVPDVIGDSIKLKTFKTPDFPINPDYKIYIDKETNNE